MVCDIKYHMSYVLPVNTIKKMPSTRTSAVSLDRLSPLTGVLVGKGHLLKGFVHLALFDGVVQAFRQVLGVCDGDHLIRRRVGARWIVARSIDVARKDPRSAPHPSASPALDECVIFVTTSANTSLIFPD